jgi:hypothetical protein
VTKPASTEPTPPRLAAFKVMTGPTGEGPPLHSMGQCRVDEPNEHMIGWSIAVRGAAVFFVSPPGWTQSRPTKDPNGIGERRILEFDRREVKFVWVGQDASAVDKLQRFDVGPMTRKALPSDERAVAIDSKDMGDA